MSATAAEPEWDLVVVGGGIHGVGVAQAGAAAGQRVLLLEERHVAAGTSSRSSKLIHGGLRYLETAQFQLVRESLAERAILVRIAPHLVRLVPFHIPVYEHTRRRPWQIRAGLSLYAVFGGLSGDSRYWRVPRSEWSGLDGLTTNGLLAVFRYFDGQTDDAALARAVLASARELGCTALYPARFLWAHRDGARYRVVYSEGNKQVEVTTSSLVNAAGPWADDVQSRIRPLPPRPAVELVAGSHIEVDGALTKGIYYVEARRDGRAVFLMPWKGHTLVGTTETKYDGDPALVKPLDSEIAYLRECLRDAMPAREGVVISAWAGLRVLPRGAGAAFSRPREVMLTVDDEREPRLVAIYGGKLTGYRSTALRVLERLAPSLARREARADTAQLALPSE